MRTNPTKLKLENNTSSAYSVWLGWTSHVVQGSEDEQRGGGFLGYFWKTIKLFFRNIAQPDEKGREGRRREGRGRKGKGRGGKGSITTTLIYLCLGSPHTKRTRLIPVLWSLVTRYKCHKWGYEETTYFSSLECLLSDTARKSAEISCLLHFNRYYQIHHTAQHGTARHGTARHGTAQHGTAQHNTTQQCTAQHSTAQHSTVQHSTAQHTQHSTVQHSTAQHSTTRHSAASHHTAVPHRTAPQYTAQCSAVQCNTTHSTARHNTRHGTAHTLRKLQYSEPECRYLFALTLPFPDVDQSIFSNDPAEEM